MYSETMILISQDIVRKRMLANITQQMIAERLAVSVNTISRWERDNFRSTKLSDLISLLEYLESRGIKFNDHTKSILTNKTS